ncbi:hypothetical protein ACOME3_007147 [Neoechinorhynchus agilis]
MTNTRPKNVGIVDFAFYLPRTYVDQGDLEQFDGVSAGKYTIGLEQSAMAVCADNEDACSMSLTVVEQLVSRVNEHPVNYYVEGIDCLNACYGGTAALFNCIDWIESSAWDGRFAIAVMTDVAIYANKAARPTGGAGAIALLIGPNAPLVIENEHRVTVARDVYDFYKPRMHVESPMVDGPLSIQCYFEALRLCYDRYRQKTGKSGSILDDHDRLIFHSPFCGLVRKAYSLLYLCDHPSEFTQEQNPESFYADKTTQRKLAGQCKDRFEKQVAPSMLLAKQVGNAYTASTYLALVSCLAEASKAKENKPERILVYSYGSGYCSSMFSIRVNPDVSSEIIMIKANESIKQWLDGRLRVTAKNYDKLMTLRAQWIKRYSLGIEHNGLASVFKDAFVECNVHYLDSIDERYRRSYVKKSESKINGDTKEEEEARLNSFIDTIQV